MIQHSRYAVGLDIGYSNVKISCGDANAYEPAVSIYSAYAESESEKDLSLAKKSECEIKVFLNGTEWRVFKKRVGHWELHNKFHTSNVYSIVLWCID